MTHTWRKMRLLVGLAVPVLCALGLLTGCLGMAMHTPPHTTHLEIPANAMPSERARTSGQTGTIADATGQLPPQTDLTLNTAIRFALTHNAGLQAMRKRIDVAAARGTQARLWPNPDLELSAEDVPVESGGLSRSQSLIGLSQTVPYPGKKTLDGRIGRQAVTVAEWEYLSREIELVRDVKTAFASALAAEKKVAVSEQLRELAQSLSDAAGKRVAAGAAADQERLRAEIEFDRVNVELTSERRDLVEAQEALATLMGRARAPVSPLRGELRETIDLSALEQAREQMLARHPNIRAAAAGKERAELELRRARLEPLPDVAVGVAGGHDLGQDDTLMAFRLSLPLPLFDRSQGRKREAQAEAEIAKYDLAATERQLIRELSVVDARLRAAVEQVEAYRTRILPKSEEALRLVRGGYEAGKFGLLDLVDTQRTLAESRLAYYERLSELNAAQAELEALLLKDPRLSLPADQPQSTPQTKE